MTSDTPREASGSPAPTESPAVGASSAGHERHTGEGAASALQTMQKIETARKLPPAPQPDAAAPAGDGEPG